MSKSKFEKIINEEAALKFASLVQSDAGYSFFKNDPVRIGEYIGRAIALKLNLLPWADKDCLAGILCHEQVRYNLEEEFIANLSSVINEAVTISHSAFKEGFKTTMSAKRDLCYGGGFYSEAFSRIDVSSDLKSQTDLITVKEILRSVSNVAFNLLKEDNFYSIIGIVSGFKLPDTIASRVSGANSGEAEPIQLGR